MIYRSFFYVCLVNLNFKKKGVLEGFQRKKFSFKNTYTYLVKLDTSHDLKNLSINNSLIRFSSKFKI